MTSSILSMHKALSDLCRQTTAMSAYGAIGILLLGLAGFLWMGWQTLTFSINTQNISLQRPDTPPPFPSISLEKEVVSLYDSPIQPSATGTGEHFRIHGAEIDDALLLDVPRAKLTATLVGILMSSNPAKHMVIIESAGQQTSYGLNDRIAGKFTILRILQDRIVINENGFYAALILDN